MSSITNWLIANSTPFLFSLNFLGGSTEETGATGVLQDAFRTFCFMICDVIYKLISFFYQIFTIISKMKIIKSPAISDIYSRVSVLLGIIMLFVLTFYLLKMLLNPDKIADKEVGIGSLIRRVAITILLIGFAPTLFDLAFDIQNTVVESNLIAKILTAKNYETGSELGTWGNSLAIQTFLSFYSENPNLEGTCESYPYIAGEFVENSSLNLASDCLNLKGKAPKEGANEPVTTYAIDFDGIPAIIVGGVMLWLIISYSIAVGVRVVQLAFLQIIAPVPIMANIIPKKDGMFNKWIKQVITTYIDLFIRLAIIYFIIFLTNEIWNTPNGNIGELLIDGATLDPNSLSNTVILWTKIVLILALLMFAKRFPQLLQDLMGKPTAANIGFGLSNDGTNIARAMATVGATGFLGSQGPGRITSALTGAAKGLKAGMSQGNFSQNLARANKEQIEENYRDNWFKEQGYNLPQRLAQRLALNTGGLTKAERIHQNAAKWASLKQLIDGEKEMEDIGSYISIARQNGIGAALSAMKANGNLREYGETRRQVGTDLTGREYDIESSRRIGTMDDGSRWEIDSDGQAYALNEDGSRVSEFGTDFDNLGLSADQIKTYGRTTDGNEIELSSLETRTTAAGWEYIDRKNHSIMRGTGSAADNITLNTLEEIKVGQGTQIMNNERNKNTGIGIGIEKNGNPGTYQDVKDNKNSSSAEAARTPLIKERQWISKQ